MPVEVPEVVGESLTVRSRDPGVPSFAVATQMHVKPRLLEDLLGVTTSGSIPTVIPLLRTGYASG